MIPIKTNVVQRHLAAMTAGLIVINAVAFLYELSLGRHLGDFFLTFAIVPLCYDPSYRQLFSPAEQVMPFFTSMFLHGGWLHIIGNMWFLWIFGRNVEDRMGQRRYLLFYLVCGVVAGAMHAASVIIGVRYGVFDAQYLAVPTIGASGAVAGVMGAYFVMFPKARVLTLVPIFFFLQMMALPAYLVLGIWFVMQFFNGSFAVIAGGQGFEGVAWWAHVGGFLVGAALAKLFQKTLR